MIKYKRTLERRGGAINLTTGVPAYIPSIAEKISNLWSYSKAYLKNKFNNTSPGTFIDLSNQNVSRIGSNTKGVKTVLANEFVEKNKNTVRKKKDFINTTDTLLGDRGIPLSKIKVYYGAENGKLKAGNINTFNNNTVIVPNRAKTVGRVKKYYPGKPASEKFNKAVDEEIRKYNNSHNYSPSIGAYINSLLTLSKPSPLGTLRTNVGRDKAIDILNYFQEKHKNLGDSELPYVITESNDTIRGYDLNATPKVMFADEKGNSVFVSNLNNNNVKKLNQFLSKHPSYPIMIDNGRYATYQTESPNVEIYSGLNSPDDMFIIGTTNRTKHKYGGIHIAPSKRGTFTAAATKHGMGVQEFASRVLRNKEDYSPSLVKKANFARNSSKWH